MTIKLDSTKFSTVVRCDECPWWAAFAEDKLDGLRVGDRHEARNHPRGPRGARSALTSRIHRASRK